MDERDGRVAAMNEQEAKATLLRVYDERDLLLDQLIKAENKLRDIRAIPSWYNPLRGEAGFDVDGDEWMIIRNILTDAQEDSISEQRRRPRLRDQTKGTS